MKINELIIEAKSNDASSLPDDVVKVLSKTIDELAQDESTNWPNAIALVHQAYEICNVERPAPFMRGAWIQYEDFIGDAVRQLAKYRPDGSWKATSSTSSSQLSNLSF